VISYFAGWRDSSTSIEMMFLCRYAPSLVSIRNGVILLILYQKMHAVHMSHFSSSNRLFILKNLKILLSYIATF